GAGSPALVLGCRNCHCAWHLLPGTQCGRLYPRESGFRNSCNDGQHCPGLVLFPGLGGRRAAPAALLSPFVLLVPLVVFMFRMVVQVNVVHLIAQPVIAATLMAISLLVTQSADWPWRLGFGVIVYFLTLLLLTETEVRSWLQIRKLRVPTASE